MLKVTNIRLPLDYTREYCERKVLEFLKIDSAKEIILDRRETVKKENEVYFKATFLVSLDDAIEEKLALIMRKKGVTREDLTPYKVSFSSSSCHPVVVGFGPAGIFSALVLAMAGLRPIVLERGKKTEDRIRDVDLFKATGVLDPESNIQFGEGGAGAFSDGKLKVGFKDQRRRFILDELVSAGADESILYLEKPHVGSDVLHRVIVNLRQKIQSLGGEIIFGAKFERPVIQKGKVTGVIYTKDGALCEIATDSVILAIGHSARDTLSALFDQGLKMEQKGFGIGVRIEHPQSLINEIEYRGMAELGAADYKMVTHLKNGRSLYTFCMCPGGFVVPAASEEGGICTNGMSEFKRDGKSANTALLVSVFPSDFPSSHPLSGFTLQREIERRAYALSHSYKAPVIRLEDFLAFRESVAFGDVMPTYAPGTIFSSPDNYLPHFITETLREGLKDMGDYKKGYLYPDAILTGPETRTTSPVKILREGYEAEDVIGLFPAGEGAGYAGGIISSALDGILCAEAVLDKTRQ